MEQPDPAVSRSSARLWWWLAVPGIGIAIAAAIAVTWSDTVDPIWLGEPVGAAPVRQSAPSLRRLDPSEAQRIDIAAAEHPERIIAAWWVDENTVGLHHGERYWQVSLADGQAFETDPQHHDGPRRAVANSLAGRPATIHWNYRKGSGKELLLSAGEQVLRRWHPVPPEATATLQPSHWLIAAGRCLAIEGDGDRFAIRWRIQQGEQLGGCSGHGATDLAVIMREVDDENRQHHYLFKELDTGKELLIDTDAHLLRSCASDDKRLLTGTHELQDCRIYDLSDGSHQAIALPDPYERVHHEIAISDAGPAWAVIGTRSADQVLWAYRPDAILPCLAIPAPEDFAGRGIALSPAGNRLLRFGQGSLLVHTLPDRVGQAPDQPRLGPDSRYTIRALHPNGAVAWNGHWPIDLRSHATIAEDEQPNGHRRADFFAEPATLMIGCSRDQVRAWHWTNADPCWSATLPAPCAAVFVDHQSDRAVVLTEDGQVVCYDPLGAELCRHSLGSYVRDVFPAIRIAGRRILPVRLDEDLVLLGADGPMGRLPARVAVQRPAWGGWWHADELGTIQALTCSRNGRALFGGVQLGFVSIIDRRTGKHLVSLPAPADRAIAYESIAALAAAPDGTTLVALGRKGGWVSWDLRTRRVLETRSFILPNGVDSVISDPLDRGLLVNSSGSGRRCNLVDWRGRVVAGPRERLRPGTD